MIKREIEISGKKVPFRSSATIPRLYRAKFKRDIFKDLSKLEKSYKGKTENGEELQIEDLEIFENVAYVMAYHADNSIPAKIEDWLDQFDMFSIYEVLPQILELWGENLVTDVTSKKRLAEVSGKSQLSMFIVMLAALVIPIMMARFKITSVPTAVAEIVVGIKFS